MPPVGVVFSNAGFGPSLKVGATLTITADSGLSTCSNIAFTGASATPTVISDTQVDVVVPAGAVVGRVKLTTSDGTFDSGYAAFYPLIPGPWTDSPTQTESHTLAPAAADVDYTTVDTDTGVTHLDRRWDLAHLPHSHDAGTAWLGFDAVGRFGGDLADASEQTEDDPVGGQTSGVRAEILLQNLGDDVWAVMQLVVVFDFNVRPGGLAPYHGSLPPEYRPGDPSDFEAENSDYLTWITSIDVSADSETNLDDGSVVVEARILPVADFEYDTSPTVSPRQGRWFPGADVGAMRNAGSIIAFTGTGTETLTFTVNPDEIRLDAVNGSHSVVVFAFADQISHSSVITGDAHFVFASATDALTAVYNYQPPRWRWLIPQYGPSRPKPLRQRQTSTGIHTAGSPLRQRQYHFGLRQRQTGI